MGGRLIKHSLASLPEHQESFLLEILASAGCLLNLVVDAVVVHHEVLLLLKQLNDQLLLVIYPVDEILGLLL